MPDPGVSALHADTPLLGLIWKPPIRALFGALTGAVSNNILEL